ncbi:isochorismatase family protein [Brachybacterium hainanense]|uniref:nicotinamidase n=1 Tax=Brachybacterium hainanense TaxID=1541174 RepID=A0ABV6RB62_9MICO
MATALLIVDAQLDFTEGGALGVAGATTAFRRIAETIQAGLRDGTLAQEHPLIVTTQDWHIDPGDHWSDSPDYVDSWPVHCEAGTPGAELNPIISLALRGVHPDRLLRVTKGEHEAAYSGFEGHDAEGAPLAELLRARGITAVDVVGVATDHCVRATALDAVSAGFQVQLIADQTAAVDLGRGQAAIQELREAGARIL